MPLDTVQLIFPKVPMKDETILKNEWCKHFNLSAFTQSKFYRIIGCFIIGVEMIKIPMVQPHLVVYPLWRNGIKQCTKHSYLLYGLLDNNGLQYQVSMKDLLKNKEYAFGLFENWVGFNIREDVMGSDVFRLLNNYYAQQTGNPWRVLDIVEANIVLSAYLNDEKMFEQSVSILDASYVYLYQHLGLIEKFYDKYDKWKERLVAMFGNRNHIVETIKENTMNSDIKSIGEILIA